MPFLRPLGSTVPHRDQSLRWPINGLAYVVAFMGPISAGPTAGILLHDGRAVVIGLVVGIVIDLLNALLIDKLLDPLVAQFQKPLQKGMPRIFANIAAFAWAIALTALSMRLPVAILGNSLVM